ncbi:MAG: glutamine amidotransferase-related protein, partial [Thiolinea sp.]
ALEINGSALGVKAEADWIGTDQVTQETLQACDGLWCIPASPYVDMEGALTAIRYARENGVPFFGSCGGYQHAALEFARNVLGYPQADNTEVNPDTEMPLISALSCALVETSAPIFVQESSRAGDCYQATEVVEEYRCSYGVNPEYMGLFADSAMRFVGHDAEGEPRVLEIAEHPFFIGTAFQPERSALRGEQHALISAFLAAAKTYHEHSAAER